MVSVMKTMVDSSKLQATKAIARRAFRWSTLCLFARVSPFINLAISGCQLVSERSLGLFECG